jgi:Ca2+-binding RTX toxin-like protein
MKLPIPIKHETTVILETYSKNEIPFKFSDVQISINGPDVVVKTADGHVFTFPFAAQFATMGKSVFTLVFADGKEISSDQLLAYATTVTAAPNAADPQAHHEVSKASAGHDKSTDAAKESKDSKDATKDAKSDDIVVVDSTAQENSAGGNQTDAAPKQPPVVHPGDLSKHRFDDEALPHVDHISGMPPKPVTPPNEPAPPAPVDPTPPTPVDPTPPTPVDPTPPTPVDPTPPPPPTLQDVNLLQTQGVADTSANVYELGGGVDAARTDGRIATQYATRDVDLSNETGNWTFHADSTVGVEQPGYMTRIINAGSVSSLTDVTIDPALAAKGVSIVLWNSPEGIALGLHSNEFGLSYPTAQGALSGPFTVHLDYIDAASGQVGSSDLAFQITAAPTAVFDQNNVYQLSSIPNDVAIHAGSGDDTLIAGHANGVYDGGGGTNTLDYSGFTSALTVDLSADVRSALGIDPTGAANGYDMGKVTSGDSVQSIENFQVVIGGQGANVFIGNQFDHQFIGGAGDNTFIAHGGNDVYTGGAGHNTLDYSHVGGTAFETVTLGASGLKLVLNGVDIDLANGVTSNNGWTDANGNAGADHFSGMTQVIGSGYNDRITGSAGNDVITGGAGNDLIIGSAGNDTIDGGGGFNTISYADLTDKIDVDLNGPTGSAIKGDGGVDSLVRIQAVIGSAGGGTLTGLVGASNLLIGTDGDTTFVTNAGNNQLYGGAGNNTFNAEQGTNSIFGGTADNTFNLDRGIDTVHGGTASNIFTVNGGNNTLYGGASNTFTLNLGSNAVYGGAGQNTVQAQGGLNTFQSGGGVNTYSAVGGSTVYNGGAGSDAFSGSNGGNNVFFGSSGTSTFSATGGGNNAISEGSGDLYVYSGGANNTVTGGGGGKTTVDYSGYRYRPARRHAQPRPGADRQ